MLGGIVWRDNQGGAQERLSIGLIARAPSRLAWEPTVLLAVGIYGIAWLMFALLSRFPGYVHFDTGEIVMWSHAGFRLGYLKHPPLLPWLVGALGTVLPLNEWTLAILSVGSMTLGAYAVWRIAVMTIGRRRAPIAMILYVVCPYLTWQAVKLNHNSILVSLWPLIVWAFLVSLRQPTVRAGIVLGLMATVGVLAKYSTFMLLGAAFVAAIASPRRAVYFKSPAPYVGAIVAGVLLLPHLLWVASNNSDSVTHALRAAATDQEYLKRFFGTNVLNVLPMLIAVPLLRLAMGRSRTATEAKPFDGRLELWLITLLPYAFMCTLIPALGMRASQSWSMPVFALLPVLLAHLLTTPDEPQTNRTYKLGYAGALLLTLIGPQMLAQSFKRSEPAVVEPRFELALDAQRIWTEATTRPLAIVAGDHRIVTSMWGRAFGRPLMWTTFVQDELTPWLRRELVRARGLLVICDRDMAACNARASTVLAAGGGARCEAERTRTLSGRAGPSMRAVIYVIAPDGMMVNLPKSQECAMVAAAAKS